MALDRAKEARKKAKAKREARFAKSKERAAERKAARKVKATERKAKKAAKGEGAVAKTLRTWSPGKYVAKFIKGEPIGVSEKPKDKPKKVDSKPDVRKIVKNIAKSKKTEKVTPQKFGAAFASARKAGKKTFTWKGKSYTTKTADDVKKAASKKAASKKVVSKSKTKVKAPSGPEGPGNDPRYDPKPGQKSTMMRNRPERKNLRKKYPPATEESRPPLKFKHEEGGMVDTYEGGGKVDSSGLFSFPSTDARKRGK